MAPPQRRGEVTAAFITGVYLGVSAAAISVGLLSDAFALPTAITIVAAAIALVAIPGAVWHLSQRNRPPELQLTSGVSAV